MNKSEKSEQNEKENKGGKRRFRALIIIILLLLLLFFLFNNHVAKKRKVDEEARKQQFALMVEAAQAKAKAISDSIARLDFLGKSRADNTQSNSPTGLEEQNGKDKNEGKNLSSSSNKSSQSSNKSSLSSGSKSSLSSDNTLQSSNKSSLSLDSLNDSSNLTDSKELGESKDKDSIAPHPSILPPSGRYYNPINLRVECPEPKCSTEISVEDSLNPQVSPLNDYNKTGTVYFRATDSAGNASSWQAAHYDMASDNECSENSYSVPVHGKTVCVDIYEYPNKAGEKPHNMVSQTTAVKLCENAGKRLCSAEEWQAACRGKQGTKYPYGNRYDQTKCITDNKTAKEPRRSGFAEHCRSYFGMYDMSGNLWEWTSTPASQEGFFLVAGGAWNTKNESSCSETKFSFYPQNEYPFVGFRCCK